MSIPGDWWRRWVRRKGLGPVVVSTPLLLTSGGSLGRGSVVRRLGLSAPVTVVVGRRRVCPEGSRGGPGTLRTPSAPPRTHNEVVTRVQSGSSGS